MIKKRTVILLVALVLLNIGVAYTSWSVGKSSKARQPLIQKRCGVVELSECAGSQGHCRAKLVGGERIEVINLVIPGDLVCQYNADLWKRK